MKVLSIDGGGIRGLIPALVLAEIESRTGRRIAELVDMIAGTSTGGILACALGKPAPLPAAEIASLYIEEGPKIFDRSLLKQITSLGGYLDERYSDKGLVQALQDIVTGRVDGMFAVIGGALPFVQSGKLKALAVSGKARNAALPNVPTFAEVGYPNFDASFYFAVAAPAGTPKDVVAKFAADAGEIVRAAEFRDKQLATLGFEPVGDTPEQFAAFLVNDRKIGAEKVKVSGAKLD